MGPNPAIRFGWQDRGSLPPSRRRAAATLRLTGGPAPIHMPPATPRGNAGDERATVLAWLATARRALFNSTNATGRGHWSPRHTGGTQGLAAHRKAGAPER